MSSAKDIIVKPIPSKDARSIVKRLHYSGKVVNKSSLNLGVFLDGRLEGAMQFGTCLDHRKMIGLVEGSKWENVMELNRMAFSDRLPKNSESRALGVAMRMMRKNAPQVKWVVSFADGTQCGDGTIYRASGFVLTGIKESFNLAKLPSGEVVHKIAIEVRPTQPRPELGGRSYYDATGGKFSFKKYVEAAGAEILPGFQLRYVYFIDKAWRKRLSVDEIPFTEIDARGARMYKGKKLGVLSDTGDTASLQLAEGGSIPTSTLQSIEVA